MIVTAEMLRQYLYCPRKIYWMYVWGSKEPNIPQVEYGKKVHSLVWKGRKILRRKGEIEKVLIRRVYMSSDSLELSGIADAIILTIKSGEVIEAVPVEIKNTFSYHKLPVRGDIIQLGAYILLASELWPCKKGILYYRNRRKRFTIEMSEELKKEIMQIIEKIKEIIRNERFPQHHADSKKCQSCEVRKFCRPEL